MADEERIPFKFQVESQNAYQSFGKNNDEVVLFCCHGNQVHTCCQDCATCLGLHPKDPNDTTTVTVAKVTSNHCHPERDEAVDKHARRRLIFASGLCLLFMIGEIVGGLMANSLAIATDAAHLLTDFASFMISLMALWIASRPATKRMSFGWYRAEVIGALTSVLLIWVVTGVLVYIAIQRIVTGEYEVDATIMLITASVGVLVNIIMGISLQVGGVPHGHAHGGGGHGHSHGDKGNQTHSHGGPTSSARGRGNINVRAAFIHVVGDFLQSLGVLVASLIIYFKPNLMIVDPICTFLFSVLVLLTTTQIMRETLNVLMEGIPKGIDFQDVQRTIASIPGVVKVHNLRVWSLSMDKIALSAHIAAGSGEIPTEILKMVSDQIRQKFDIFELTLQVEEYRAEMNECNQCQDPKD